MNQLYEQAASRKIQRLKGMNDISRCAYERCEDVLHSLRKHMASYGYQPIDTPLLEQTELFVRKAGGDIAGRLYNFTDPGGNSVSLRPEFTSSVIRHFVDNQQHLSLPVRWQYSGPVFRYETAGQGAYRQFTQSGAEIVGADGAHADSEIISMAAHGIRALGLDDLHIRIGHLGVLHSLLDHFGLSEAAKLFVIGNIQALRNGSSDIPTLMQHAREVGLLRGGLDIGLETALESMSAEAAEKFIFGALKESVPAPVGRRTTDRIIARLLNKVRSSDAPDAFNSALCFARKLAQLAGEPHTAMQQARAAVAEYGISHAPLDDLYTLLDMLPDSGIPYSQLTLDLGMARGISYYTGIIFELTMPHSCTNTPIALGGGGRYDGLVQALGGSHATPAMGFAYNINALLDTLHPITPAPNQGLQYDER